VADFGGRVRASSAEARALAAPLRIDAVDFEKAFARFEPRLTVTSASGAVEQLNLASLDDLHPDHLFESLELFAPARELRRSLAMGGNAQVFERARRWLHEQGAVGSTPGEPQPALHAGAETDESTLQRLLGASRGATQETASKPAVSPAQALIERAVRPHVVPGVAPEQGPLLAQVDRVIGDEMRRILRSAEYRELESSWRAAERVVRSLDTDEELEVWLLDASRTEISAAFEDAGSDLEASRVHARLVKEGRHWTVVACDFSFGGSDQDLMLLAQLAATVARAGGVLLADAAPSLLGAPMPALGQALRTSPLARQIGLVFPRVLARRPYGKKRDPIAAFAFEEITETTGFDSAERVWGSGAFALAELLGTRFRSDGWDADDGTPLDLDDLPLDTFEDEHGESQLVPCAEVALAESALAAVLARGVTPLVARRDRASVRLARLVSVRDPSEPLILLGDPASDA
jgi:predicted component of type VI protein secretion system